MSFTQSASIRDVTAPSNALVSPAWLAAHLYDPEVRIVEVDVNSVAYDEWHIDGAVLWDIYRDLKDPDYRTVDMERLEELLGRSGITPTTMVVFYGYAPAFGLWLLEFFGHVQVGILDCDRDAWRGDGRPWATSFSQPTQSQYLRRASRPAIRSIRDGVEGAIGRPGTTLVDVRSAPEFAGERFWPSGGQEPGGRSGHIPSAVHVPLAGLYEPNGSFRPPDALRTLFGAADIDGADELILYCTIGGRAATAWFVLTHLLRRPNVSVYDGSWAEWGRLPDTPVSQHHTANDPVRSSTCPD